MRAPAASSMAHRQRPKIVVLAAACLSGMLPSIWPTIECAFSAARSSALLQALAGKAGGRLKGDAHLNFKGESLSRALLTAAQIMGWTKKQIGGVAGVTSAALPGIKV